MRSLRVSPILHGLAPDLGGDGLASQGRESVSLLDRRNRTVVSEGSVEGRGSQRVWEARRNGPETPETAS